MKILLPFFILFTFVVSCSKGDKTETKKEKVYTRVTIFSVLSPGAPCPPCYLVGFVDSTNVVYRTFSLPNVSFPTENPAIVKILYHDTTIIPNPCSMHNIVIDDIKQ
jgi:hypothetical protein